MNLCYVIIQCYGLIAPGCFGKLAQFTKNSECGQNEKDSSRKKIKLENNLLLESIVKECISLQFFTIYSLQF